MKRQNIYLKQELNTIIKIIINYSTNVIIFDKDGNKVSQTETFNEVDNDTIKKERIT